MFKLATLKAAGFVELRKLQKGKKGEKERLGLSAEKVSILKGKFGGVRADLLPNNLFACALYYPARFLAMMLDPSWFLHGSESDRR